MEEQKKRAKRSAKKKSVKKSFIYAVGRRKTASARVRLYLGKGEMLVNGKLISQYFPGKTNEVFYTKPLRICNVLGKYYATVKVVGSGKNAQLEAVVHGLARALDKLDKEQFHSFLKKHKLLTRDSRMRERRKAGQAGRARHKKQSPKR
ncbi:MAG TPA: 30S ribosomal protein S9 [Candidatus Bathyarchaeia archaeon]|nr:30S ribosomal protein S9 [Candidatus Bathyarchaeia archaeon]